MCLTFHLPSPFHASITHYPLSSLCILPLLSTYLSHSRFLLFLALSFRKQPSIFIISTLSFTSFLSDSKKLVSIFNLNIFGCCHLTETFIGRGSLLKLVRASETISYGHKSLRYWLTALFLNKFLHLSSCA